MDIRGDLFFHACVGYIQGYGFILRMFEFVLMQKHRRTYSRLGLSQAEYRLGGEETITSDLAASVVR